jgi:type II secretory ATPase GspE/PulE/Tfp pilus assembly ATPase PilB-like protein
MKEKTPQFRSAVEAIEALLGEAARLNASDIHIDPTPPGLMIRMRIDGQLETFASVPRSMHDELVARLKILSGARTDLHSIPQDGRFRKEIEGSPYNIRVSFMPTYHGENAVIRLLSASGESTDSFASLGFSPDHVSILERSLRLPNGLILVTGPTGSGKTTTLRVCLGIKAAERIAVMTLEDPVEYEVPGVRHVHIRESFGVTFASGLRSALRQDPDVIMVGEIRDEETARTAVATALTGHLVLSTLHTGSAIEAVSRLADMGLPRYLIADTLKLVVSQRLVRTICRECGGAEGCIKCRGTGYRGRSVIAECLEIDGGMRDLIMKGEPTRALREHAVSRGFREMPRDGDEKVEWGITTRSEVLRALDS